MQSVTGVVKVQRKLLQASQRTIIARYMELCLIVVLSSKLAEFIDACYDAVNFAVRRIRKAAPGPRCSS